MKWALEVRSNTFYVIVVTKLLVEFKLHDFKLHASKHIPFNYV